MRKDAFYRLDRLRAKKKESKKLKIDFPDLKTEERHQLSNNLQETGGFKRNKREDHKWRKDTKEKPATVVKIEEKARRIRPHYSKGGYSYATDGDNAGEIRIYRK